MPSTAPVAQEQAYAQHIVNAQFPGQPGEAHAFDNVIQQESTWNPRAVNDTNPTAQGLGQLEQGPRAGTDYQTQLNAALHYMLQRYGTPDGAWAHETTSGWY
ncbi:transglycosylase SLT domain-containing protein [Streptomyces sp. NBC_01264]|uniref:aggregation-promoting factor C-terminal-like domain-containing protein n=1 Tax=Streptomyces sp. NBC_01264 TaxID=2903804 RepID=UPI0022517C40|nr:transglycosylase SLT domain-containing protein [Streptomyces sp. NBC_01264]MCX4775462.1 lytic transglycosylase domain-containing protein [Streptomyces sp. NBC_01264]